VTVIGEPAASFVLLSVPGGAAVRNRLREQGWAVRRGDTFPGLSVDHLRVAVRDPATSRAFAAALAAILDQMDVPEEHPLSVGRRTGPAATTAAAGRAGVPALFPTDPR
jgi:histidinol-phosphate aminotransferase